MNTQTTEHWALLKNATAHAADSIHEINASLSSLTTEQVSEALTVYAEHWAQVIVPAAAKLEVEGLTDLCVVYEEAMLSICEKEHAVIDKFSALLAEWHHRFDDYLDSSGNKKYVAAMLGILQSPLWSYPLDDEDVTMLSDVFQDTPTTDSTAVQVSCDAEVVDVSMNTQTTEPWKLLESTVAQAADSIDKTNAVLSSLTTQQFIVALKKYVEHWTQNVVPAAAHSEVEGVTDLCSVYEEAVLSICEQEQPIIDKTANLLIEWHQHFDDYLVSPDNKQSVAAMLNVLQSPLWPYPLDDEDVTMLLDVFQEIEVDSEIAQVASENEWLDGQVGDQISVPVIEESPEINSELAFASPGIENESLTEQLDEPISIPPVEESLEVTVVNPELVNMIREEFLTLVEELNHDLSQLDDSEIAPEDWKVTLDQHVFKLQNLSTASETVQLYGLHQIFDFVHENLQARRESDPLIDKNEWTLVSHLLLLIQVYFEDVTEHSTCTALVDQLQLPGWKHTISIQQAEDIAQLLTALRIEIPKKDIESLQTVAKAEDVSLQVSEDVNQDILDSLFNELPSLTADFSAAIQRIISSQGNIEDLQEAQRIAHTLKGSGGIVGLTGIATLTHRLEDILSALAEQGIMPIKELGEILQQASDCLESMTEYLLGLSDEPEQALDVLQEVMNWANRIFIEGVPLESDVSTEKKVLPVSPPQQKQATAPKGTQHSEAATRVPSSLVDQLLRMSGEESILNEQVKEQSGLISNDVKSVKSLGWSLHLLISDLDNLLNVQSLSTSHIDPLSSRQDFDSLEMDQYNELHTCASQLAELVMDIRETNADVEKRIQGLSNLLVDQKNLQTENQELIQSIRMAPVQSIISRCQRVVRQACRMTGKQVELDIQGSDVLVDSKILNDLMDPLMHLLRNAVDHGIESVEKRTDAGKDVIGKILLSFESKGNYLSLVCQDDGGGLDSRRIHDKAISKGLIPAGQILTENEINQLILSSGFSTREEVTQVSGRGVGMDAIKTHISQLKGSMGLSSQQGEGLQVSITVPLSMSSMQVLLVRCGKYFFAIAMHGVDQVIHSGGYTVNASQAEQALTIAEKNYDFLYLHSLLGMHLSSSGTAGMPALLVHNEAGEATALLVDELIGSRDMLIKNMGRYIPNISGIIGASIMGDGGIAPVLDIPELIRRASQNSQLIAEQVVDQSVSGLPTALVVDDSLSARRSLAHLLQDSGFDVVTAIDGMDAIDQIEKKRPDILLVDMEMPRMNGIELTAHVRNTADIAGLPIIMITSRSSEKHRKLAEAAGISKQIIKPYSEDDLLRHIYVALENNIGSDAAQQTVTAGMSV